LRERLRGSDIWVAGSRDYRAFEDYLLPAEAGRNLGIDQETDPANLTESQNSTPCIYIVIDHKMLYLVLSFSGSGDRNGWRIE